MTSAPLHDQVVDQARLLVRLLARVGVQTEGRVVVPEPVAGIADLLFQGFEHLYDELLSLGQPNELVHVEEANEPDRVVIPDPDAKRRIYREMVDRIHARVAREVPTGSVVAIVSRGDGSLLQLPGRTGWHFPQNSMGVWAGYHPASGREAIDHLQQLQQKGAQYLLIPGTSLWWLDYYDELNEHLQSSARLVTADGDLALYQLVDNRRADETSPQAKRYARQVKQFTDFTGVLLPHNSAVVVASCGDDALLAIPDVVARHFPSTGDGTYEGHPTDDSAAIVAVAKAVVDEMEYLAIPASSLWWRQTYPKFCLHLDHTYRCIAEQAEAGAIYELTRPEADEA